MQSRRVLTPILTLFILLSMMPVGFAQTTDDAAPVGFSIKNMDLKADPRKDFTRYAMGSWLDRSVMRDDQSEVFAASWLLDTLDERLLEIAKNAAAEKGAKGSDVQLVGDLYTSAMDTKRLESLGLKPLDDVLAMISKARSRKQIAELAAKLYLGYGSPFFKMSVGPDSKKNEEYALYLDVGYDSRGFGLNQREMLEEQNQKLRDQYHKLIVDLSQIAGDKPAEAKAVADKSLSYEMDAAKYSLTPVQKADPNVTYNKMSLAEVKSAAPAFDFDSFFAAVGMKAPNEIIVDDPGALKGFQKWLSTTSSDDLHSYLRAYIIRKSTTFLGGDLYKTGQEYQRIKYGLLKMQPREKDTVAIISTIMAHPLSKLYVKEYFTPEQKQFVDEMMDQIKAEFKKRIESNDWLSEPTKKTALAKLERIHVLIGYPEKESDWIDYSRVKITPDDFLGNVARLREFNSRYYLNQLGTPVEVDKFTIPGKVTPISMNAAIHQGFLTVYVTAAFVNPPYYVASNDPAAKFGSLGAVVGHELTHAFDSKGRNYDVTGNLRDWWAPEDAAKFKERADKIVAQYSAYEVAPGVKVNGQLTLSENIADLGGLRLAYNALQTYMAKNGRLPDIEGVTPEQRLFVAWAQAWAAKSRVEALKLRTATDPHSPSLVRSYGAAVNMDEFFTAFNIKPGDPMWRDPKDRVTIW